MVTDIARDRPYSTSSKKGDKAEKRQSYRKTESALSRNNSQESPQLTSKHKRKFIKNIRPEAFRRPSTYSCTGAEAKGNVVGRDCQLVGYRKKVSEYERDADSSGYDTASVIGTFSPMTSDHSNMLLTNSLSMPSLMSRSSWSRASINSLPDYMDREKVPYGRRRQIKSELFPKGVVHSDPDMRGRINLEQLQGVAPSESTPPPGEGREGESQPPPGESDKPLPTLESSDKCLPSSVDCDSGLCSAVSSTVSITGHNDSRGKGRPSRPSAHSNTFSSLANDITKALNENESWYVTSDVTNDEDESDDETCVANGYDEFLDSACGINSESDSFSLPQDSSNSVSGETRRASDGNPQSDQSPKLGISTRDSEPVGPGEKGSTPSLSKDSGIITLDSEESDLGEDKDKMTVIEFLRTEYGAGTVPKAAETPVRLSQRISLSTTTQHQQRAASDTNLYQSVGTPTSSTGSADTVVCDTPDLAAQRPVVSSFSFPELSKYADNDRPKLVTQVGFSTLRYIASRHVLHRSLLVTQFLLFVRKQ